MKKLVQLWGNLRSSFWFMPSLIVAGSIAVAAALIEAESEASELWLARWPRLFGAGAEGARGMLSTIAGSIMSVVGVTFSMTLVTLALASSQYTSRILRTFMRSRVTQGVLGIFTGVFTYCLIVLRTIRSGNETEFVPSLAVFLSVVLALGGVVVLIFFIHHIASSIQASNIIASVAQETVKTVDRVFPGKLADEHAEAGEGRELQLPAEGHWHIVPARVSGYIQSVDDAALLRLARDRKTVVRMERGVGEFVVQNAALASVALEDPPDERTIADLQATFSVGRHRVEEHDVAFGVRQIVDVALKALSAGINDTTTAVTCVDYLSVILARLAPRSIPSSYRDEDGELRVISRGLTFESLLAESFDEIRRSAGGNVTVISRMLEALQTLTGLTGDSHRRRELREHGQRIAELAERTVASAQDRAKIGVRLMRLGKALELEHA